MKKSAERIFHQLQEWKWDIDILINNAGFNECGYFKDTDLEKELRMIDLHIRFNTEIMKYILTAMQERGYGRIVNVGSTGSYIPTPFDAVYAVTKAYLSSFANAPYGELGDRNVMVTTLCPDAARTEFAQKAGIEHSPLFKIGAMSPQKVAELSFAKILRGKRVIIVGVYNKLLVFFSRVLPIKIRSKLTLFIMKNKFD